MSIETSETTSNVLDQWPIKPLGKISGSIPGHGKDTFFVKLPTRHGIGMQIKPMGIVYKNTALLLITRVTVEKDCAWFRDIYVGHKHISFFENNVDEEFEEPTKETLKQALLDFLQAYERKLNKGVVASE